MNKIPATLIADATGDATGSRVKAVVGRCDYCKKIKLLLGPNQFGMWYCGDPCWTRTHPHAANQTTEVTL